MMSNKSISGGNMTWLLAGNRLLSCFVKPWQADSITASLAESRLASGLEYDMILGTTMINIRK